MRDPLRTDAARLAFLDWLTTRTEIQHPKVPPRAVGSDMHFDKTGCQIYVRNLTGRVVAIGHGATVRGAIDDCIASVGWQEPTP